MSCNVIGQYIDFSCKSIEKSFKLILDKYYDLEVLKKYLDKYIEVRYLGLGVNDKKMVDVLDSELLKVYRKNKENDERYKLFLELFEFVYYFDDVLSGYNRQKIISKLYDIRKNKLNLDNEDFGDSFSKFWDDVVTRRKNFVSKFECLDFSVKYRKIFNSNLYDVSIGYNIEFPKLYSEYAIDKVFNTGIISEDKLFILYYMVSVYILKKVIKSKFDSNYLVEFNTSLFLKREKFSRLLNIFDNDVCRDVICFKVCYDKFLLFKNDIYSLIKAGYKFCVLIDDSFNDNINLLDVFEYILIDKKSSIIDSFNKYNNVILV